MKQNNIVLAYFLKLSIVKERYYVIAYVFCFFLNLTAPLLLFYFIPYKYKFIRLRPHYKNKHLSVKPCRQWCNLLPRLRHTILVHGVISLHRCVIRTRNNVGNPRRKGSRTVNSTKNCTPVFGEFTQIVVLKSTVWGPVLGRDQLLGTFTVFH